MACATLKRSLDWDPMLGQPAKRRRCIPFCTSPSHKDRPGGSSPSSSGCTTPKAKSVFPDVISQKMTPGKYVLCVFERMWMVYLGPLGFMFTSGNLISELLFC